MLQVQDRGEVGKPEHPRCSPVFRPKSPEEMEISGATWTAAPLQVDL